MKKTHLTTGLLTLSILLFPLTFPLAINAQQERKEQLTIAQKTPKKQQSIIIHLQNGTNDIHAALMALKVGNKLLEKGTKVTLVLTLEGVRIADTRQPLDLRWGMSDMTLSNLYEEFVKAGGEIRVCPLCAQATGLNVNLLRQGAQFAQEDNDIAGLILMADKVMSF
jgi:predicted peroxiredoxin